jgi:AAA family ATP:ADP antiporter
MNRPEKTFQALVPEERRGRVSLFMDGYLLSMGTILGSLITGAMLLISQSGLAVEAFYLYLGIALELAIFALWSVNQMRLTYEKSLFNWRLKRRQRYHPSLKQL